MRSVDHGETWSSPQSILLPSGQPKWSDRPVLVISPDGRHVYIAFNASDSYVVASHDYGEHFAAPVKSNQDRRYWFHSGGAVAPNGDVYFATVDYSQDYSGEAHINVLESEDGGLTWTTTRVDTSEEMPDCEWADGCYFGFLGPSAALAIDAAGTVMLAYHAGTEPAQPQKMWVRVSPDGLQWSPRHEISSGDETVNNAFPALVAGPSPGDFRLVWQANQSGDVQAWNTWYRQTTSGGQSWKPVVRLSDLASGAPYKDADGFFFPYGDYLEMAVDGSGVNYIIWGEGSSYTGPGGSWYTRGQ
jgi:hypothetical protein